MDLEVHNLDEEMLLKNIDEPDGMVLKDISGYALSSDVHTPMSPMRPTQGNIGLQLVKKNESNERFGVPKEQYGGVGPKYCKDPKYCNVPRTLWHVRTGLHEEIQPPVTPRNRDRIVQKNKHFWSTPVSEVGHEVYDAWYNRFVDRYNHFVDRRAKEVHKSIFPRSIVYELDYIKNENQKIMLAALEKEREAFEEKKMTLNKTTETTSNNTHERGKKSGESTPPFWWNEKASRSFTTPFESHTQDALYTASCNVPTNGVPKTVSEGANGYRPGEIHSGGTATILPKKDMESPCPNVSWKPKDALQRCDPIGMKQTVSPEQIKDTDQVDSKERLNCQCQNDLAQRHLRAVMTSTPLRPVVPPKKVEAAEITAQGCMSVSGICGSESYKQGKSVKTQKPDVVENGFPTTEIRYIPYEEKERQSELFKVGIPFWTQAARWMEANKDPLPPTQPIKNQSSWKD